jgi:hypothetical protein
MQRKPPLHVFTRPFYVKVAGASFALGAAIELFMLKTGFYDTCARAAVTHTRAAAPLQGGRARRRVRRARREVAQQRCRLPALTPMRMQLRSLG